jgi:membrane protein
MEEGYASRPEGVYGTAAQPMLRDGPSDKSGVKAQPESDDPDPGVLGGGTRSSRASSRWLAGVGRRYEGSLVQGFFTRLNDLDFTNQIMLLGAGLLISLLPFLILLSAFASERVDDDIALRLGADHRAADILTRLFRTSPASVNGATVSSLLFVLAGALAVASSLQQIYEKTFGQTHRGGVRSWPRLFVWIAVLCGVMAFQSVVERPARNISGGRALADLVGFAILTPFFWWTTHFLLEGRVRWRKLLPAAVATGVLFVGLGVFSGFYFSSTIISDSQTYGAIGAVFTIATWLIAIGAVIILGAVAGAVWLDRRSPPNVVEREEMNESSSGGSPSAG